jgi:hypothetical protein
MILQSSAYIRHVKFRRLFFQTFIKHACMTPCLEDNQFSQNATDRNFSLLLGNAGLGKRKISFRPAWVACKDLHTEETLFETEYRRKAVISGSLSPRHGASSGCGWRNGLRYGGYLRIYWISSRRQPRKGDAPPGGVRRGANNSSP